MAGSTSQLGAGGPDAGVVARRLSELMAAVAAAPDAVAGVRKGLDHAAVLMGATGAAILAGRRVIEATGILEDDPAAAVAAVSSASSGASSVAPSGSASDVAAITVPLIHVEDRRLVLVRPRPAFTPGDTEVAAAVAKALSVVGHLAEIVDRERHTAREMTERQRLYTRLSRIERSISHRAPLQEVLDAITAGARDLLGDEMVGLRLIDPDDPSQLMLVASTGVPDPMRARIHRSPLGQGAGGQAVTQRRLVIIGDYQNSESALSDVRADAIQAAMAAPVFGNGKVVGSLVVASHMPGRTYSTIEQDALVAFADHASMALTDAQTVESMREAQRAKDLFLAMVSHELKTPLTVMMGILRTIQLHWEALDRELRNEMLTSAYGRGEQLGRMINRLLQGARAELAGSFEDVALDNLINQATEGFDHLGRLAVHASNVMVRADIGAVREVLGVLLENAVAHAPGDSLIGVRARVEGPNVVVTVINAGDLPAGVDPAHLFTPFQRGDSETSSGVGLGLYIAARLAESVGGTLNAQSGDGVVSFTLRFPASAEPD
jgi:K+-sensing histidine kinase KdpD